MSSIATACRLKASQRSERPIPAALFVMRHCGLSSTRKILASAFLLIGAVASCQTTPNKELTAAANEWMLTPTPMEEANKGISLSLRKTRDEVWDAASMSPGPLTNPVNRGTIPSGEDLDMTFAHNSYDLCDAPNRAILIGTFTAHRSVLSASEYSLYTEITIHVDQVLEDQAGSMDMIANRDITVIVYGGTVSWAAGGHLSINTQPRQFFLQPDHKYLLLLSYNGKGDFYKYGDSWDLSNGTAQPNTHRTQYVARHGLSQVSGVGIWEVGDVVMRELHGANPPIPPRH